MNMRVEDDLILDSDIVTLRGVRPVINDTVIDTVQPHVDNSTPGQIVLHYDLPGSAVFSIELHPGWLRYWIDRLDAPPDSFGLRFEAVENAHAYLRCGYLSWDGSAYVSLDQPQHKSGFAMTQILPRQGSGSLVLGFDRHDRFQHTFTFDTTTVPPTLAILTLWDQKDLPASGRCESERLMIIEKPSADAEHALQTWAHLVAESSPIPPRLTVPPIIGWCSWYNLYAYINEDIILDHLRGVADISRREKLPMRIFQIDDGFTPEMGDWLDVKPQFPRGMKPLLDDIRAEGFTPGLWIAPFMVGNRSRLYHEHPDWVVQDRQTGGPLAHMKMYAEFRWHKRSEEYYILDVTHPDAFEYIRHVFHVWRWEWGCEYFKTDFMHFGSEYGPDRARWHTSGKTRIDIWRTMTEMIREELGDAIWLGCGCPLWASVGLVDGIRIGRDVGVQWRGEHSTEPLLHDLANRHFANRILWQADPDCILLRERFHHLSDAELRSAAIYAAMPGGVIITSDALDKLSPERLRQWKLLLNPDPAPCRYPLLGNSDVVIVQVRASNSLAAIFMLNAGDITTERTYTLESLGLPTSLHIYDWTADRAWDHPVERFSITLAAHDGVLLFAAVDPILSAPEFLP
jgi:hypothetical protein